MCLYIYMPSLWKTPKICKWDAWNQYPKEYNYFQFRLNHLNACGRFMTTMCVRVCVYVCVRGCVRVWVCVCMCVNIWVSVNDCWRVWTCVNKFEWVNVSVSVWYKYYVIFESERILVWIYWNIYWNVYWFEYIYIDVIWRLAIAELYLLLNLVKTL